MSFEMIFVLIYLGAALAIGFWCRLVWRRRGHSPWTGFVVGFLPVAALIFNNND